VRGGKFVDIELRQIEVGSPLHASEQRLRDEVLRRPLGRALSATDMDRDRLGVHFAAVRGDEVVACVGLYPDGEGLLRLRQMAVAPALQGHGLGAQVLSFAEDWARGRGVAEIELHAREPAIGFYERYSYAREGDIFEEVGIPHVVMRKRLTR
jgi:GNAT superfamily N-acetyltransferase